MLNTLKEHGIIGSTHLDKKRKTQLADMVFEKSNKTENIIGSEMMNAAIIFYKEKDKNISKLTAFLLCASIGLERKQIHDLKWEHVELKRNYILIDERKVPISPMLHKCFETMYEEKKSKKIKIDYVFTSFYGGKYKQVAENFINTACNQLQEINDGNEKWSLISPEYLRRCLITNMFEVGYSLEEIIYLTGIDIKNIFKYIDYEKIIEKQSDKMKKFSYKKLYDGIFENV